LAQLATASQTKDKGDSATIAVAGIHIEDGLMDIEEEIKQNKLALPRYIAVAGTSVLIGTATLLILTEIWHIFYLISAVIGSIFSVIDEFILNERWTFSHRNTSDRPTTTLMGRFLRFLSSKLAGFIIAITALAVFTQVIGIHYFVSNFLAMGFSFIWNYSLSYFWVWAKQS
jgi:dolichol-phosphate mannosyltransferase